MKKSRANFPQVNTSEGRVLLFKQAQRYHEQCEERPDILPLYLLSHEHGQPGNAMRSSALSIWTTDKWATLAQEYIDEGLETQKHLVEAWSSVNMEKQREVLHGRLSRVTPDEATVLAAGIRTALDCDEKRYRRLHEVLAVVHQEAKDASSIAQFDKAVHEAGVALKARIESNEILYQGLTSFSSIPTNLYGSV